MISVVIPSYGRPEAQPVYDFFMDMGHDPILAVNSVEDAGGRRCRVLPHNHVGEVRQRILDTWKGKVIVIDDDAQFHRWNGEKFRRCIPEDMDDLLREVSQMLETYAHVGLADRFMGHTRQRPLEFNKRYLKFIAYNTHLFPDPWPQFRLPVSEDLDFNLQLLRAGRENCILTEWAVSDRGQYKPGGCQRYRTDEVEREVCEWLSNEHPGVYSYVQDRAGRWRSRVAWRQALGRARAAQDAREP